MSPQTSRLELEVLSRKLTALWTSELGLHISDVRKLSRQDQRTSKQGDRFADIEVDISLDGRRSRVLVELRNQPPTLADLPSLRRKTAEARKAQKIYCLVVPKLLRRNREELRQAEINHGDMRGTLFLRAPGILVNTEPRLRSTNKPDDLARQSRQADPFADRTSLVLRALFKNYRHGTSRLAEIAQSTSLSIGWVSIVVRELIERDYAIRLKNGVRLNNPTRILSDWISAYRWQNNLTEGFEVPFEYHEILDKLSHLTKATAVQENPSWALTLHAAANLVAPHVAGASVALYVTDDAEERLRNWIKAELYGEPVSKGGSIQLCHAFYSYSALFDARVIRGLQCVSSVQLFLDLATYPLRGAEAASMLLRTELAEELALEPKERNELLSQLR